MAGSFLSPEPIVRLVRYFPDPFRNVVATAKTCYSSNGIVGDEQIDLERSADLAKNIYLAGHHTTFQHATLQFAISNVSRHFVWSFLHNHPFYNSEQVSQRYTDVKDGTVVVPAMKGEALAIYQRTVDLQMNAYRELVRILEVQAAEAYFDRYPARRKFPERYRREIHRKAAEIARYVLPVGTFTYMYHTISVLTLLRYYRMSMGSDVPIEQRIVVGKMVDELLRIDPSYRLILEEPLDASDFSESKISYDAESSKQFREEFDREMGGTRSKLRSYQADAEMLLADAVRGILGKPKSTVSDDAAIDLVLNPEHNRLRSQTLVLGHHSKTDRALSHVVYVFQKRLSHSADSQNQRHRGTPSSKPVIRLHQSDEPDYITPLLIQNHSGAEQLYRETMDRIWVNAAALRDSGIPDESVQYLLPNALTIRFFETSDLMSLLHKHAMRLCYNAQEEIWNASLEEVRAITKIHPRIGRALLPPCGIRFHAGQLPYCPEGDRYCGVNVWKMEPAEYERSI